jgi:CDP-diacylglycerol--glycerol-3-phosphate 3-phosphatidyltransferase
MTLPNYLTFLRLLVPPLFLFVFIFYESFGLTEGTLPYALLVLMSFAEITDAFDGYLARKFNQISDLGKILDPMADSLCHVTYFLTFTQKPISIPLFLVFIFIYRDALISTLRTICALQGVALSARKSGKLKSIVQAIASFTILLLLIGHTKGVVSQEVLSKLSTTLVAIAAFLSIISGFEYLLLNKSHILKMMKLKS